MGCRSSLRSRHSKAKLCVVASRRPPTRPPHTCDSTTAAVAPSRRNPARGGPAEERGSQIDASREVERRPQASPSKAFTGNSNSPNGPPRTPPAGGRRGGSNRGVQGSSMDSTSREVGAAPAGVAAVRPQAGMAFAGNPPPQPVPTHGSGRPWTTPSLSSTEAGPPRPTPTPTSGQNRQSVARGREGFEAANPASRQGGGADLTLGAADRERRR